MIISKFRKFSKIRLKFRDNYSIEHFRTFQSFLKAPKNKKTPRSFFIESIVLRKF